MRTNCFSLSERSNAVNKDLHFDIHIYIKYSTLIRGGSRISSLGGLALRETIRYKDTNYLNKQYFTVLMKTVLLYEVIRHNYLLNLVSDSHVFLCCLINISLI